MANQKQITVEMIPTGEATAIIPIEGGKKKPVTVIGTEAIRETFDETCLQQTVNSRTAPGVENLVLNPDAHMGFGAPIGCVMSSSSHIYPGPVGVDIKCSMSLLQFDLPADQILDRRIRRALINAIVARTPTGAGKGQRNAPKSRHVPLKIGKMAAIAGASEEVCHQLGIPLSWRQRCEDSVHTGHDETGDALSQRLEKLIKMGMFPNVEEKISQLGSYGGGNHFGECEIVHIADHDRARNAADMFGLKDGCVAFLSHCGSRGFGHNLAVSQFKTLENYFRNWGIPFPSGDKQLVYAPLGTPEANDYLDDMALGANFATVNHLLINALILEAFEETFPGIQGELVYLISHNIARREVVDNKVVWVMRKGATRAFPAGHHALKDTPFYQTGHPILLPGNPQSGSAVMAAEAGAEKSLFSVNHGAGRALGRKQAFRQLDQAKIDQSFEEHDILTNCRKYPRDEAPAAYKNFDEVLRSVTLAGLAKEVARLQARFVIKDESKADD